jgi:integrase
MHLRTWRSSGLSAEKFTVVADTPPVAPSATRGVYRVEGLPEVLTLELQYGLQRVRDRAQAKLPPSLFNRAVAAVREHAEDATSLLDRPVAYWTSFCGDRPRAFLNYVYDQLVTLAEHGSDEWAKDRWDLRRLGLHGSQTGREFRFDQIRQRWLREAGKRWVRHNLSRDLKVGTARHHVLVLRQFSTFLTEASAARDSGGQLTREHIEEFLAWMLHAMPQARTRNRRVSGLKVFLEDCRRFEWAPVRQAASIHRDDFSRVGDALPRALSEYVMAQLESDDRLAELADDGTRAIVLLLIRTGIRIGDLIRLPFDPVSHDPAGAPYLDFHVHKLRKDHRVPLDERAARAIREQQTYVHDRWPESSPWLFPGIFANPHGQRHFTYATVLRRLNRWVTDCRVVNEHGQPVWITPHQFRHTLGTRMINDGVPQHVVQRLYGHDSAEMTAVYARLTDQTLRSEFDRWSASRVNVHGEVVLHDPGDEAAWVKQRLTRAKQTLPNGYCGRPLQQSCPHPNACLTCPDFCPTANSSASTATNSPAPAPSSPPAKPAGTPAWSR